MTENTAGSPPAVPVRGSRIVDAFVTGVVYVDSRTELNMRYSILAAAAVLVLFPLSSLADENFIPMGQDYGLGKNTIPPLDSEQSKFDAQVDIYQSEVYNRNMDQKVFDSRIFNLANDQSPGENLDDDHLDY